MKEASSTNGEFDMRTLFDHTLTASQPELSVTFVDNHDTQEGQALQSWIPAWFKEHAYSLILLRKKKLLLSLGEIYMEYPHIMLIL